MKMTQIPGLYRLLCLPRPRIQGGRTFFLCRLHLQIYNPSLLQTSSKACKRAGPNRMKVSNVRMFCESREVSKQVEDDAPSVSGETLQQIARQIRNKASEFDKMAMSVPLRSLTESVKMLIENGFSVSECLELASNPVIIKHFSNFTTLYSTFIQYGYKPETVTQIFKKLPELVTLNEKQLIAQYVSLRSLGFTDTPLETIVTHSPDFLLTDVAKVSAVFSLFKTYFTSPDVVRIFEQSPGVFKETLEDLEAKIMYAIDKMDATNRQMLSSNFFQHSLAHIETRHTFVVRAGFWRIARKKKIHFENPLLRDILDTSDAEFVKMFGNMTVQDYETFKTLFEKEREQDIDSDRLNPMFKIDDGEYSD